MYKSLKMEIEGYADGSWPKMLTAKEVFQITGVAEDEIIGYAKAKVCPHVLVSKKEIFFMRTHIVKWLRENVMEVHDGVQLKPVPVLVKEAMPWMVPQCLSMVSDRLIEVPKVSGIYFLVFGDEVIYVGQSKDVGQRIMGHGEKVYDSVFILPCGLNHLNRVEAAFIGLLKPEMNMDQARQRFVHNNATAFNDPSSVLNDLTLTREDTP
jgi:hypothetical protein